jgi:hypothetical protein
LKSGWMRGIMEMKNEKCKMINCQEEGENEG